MDGNVISSDGFSSRSAKTNYVRNVMILSTGFFGIFLAYNTTQSLETTVVSDKNLGDVSLAVLYACFTCMAVPAPKIVQILGPKVSMIVGALPYALGCLANIKPSYAITVPAFGLIGIGASLLWTGQAVYLGRCAMMESLKTGERQDRLASRFNGTFFAAFQFNGVIGNLIAAIAFTGSSSKDTATYLYIGLAAAAGVGILILWFIKSIPPLKTTDGSLQQPLKLSIGGDDDNAESKSDSVGLVETLKLAVTSSRMTLIIPIILYNGMSLGFFFSDFPGFYAKKGERLLLPSSTVGYVSACFFLVNSAASYGWGRLVAKIGRAGSMTIATSTHIVYYALMLFVTRAKTISDIGYENTGSYVIPFVMASLFAFGDAVWESQPPAVLQSASFFPDERDRDAAQGNLKVFQSLGFAIQFALGFIVKNIAIKLGILFGLQVLAAISLYFLHNSVVSLDAGKPTAAPHDNKGGYGGFDGPVLINDDGFVAQ